MFENIKNRFYRTPLFALCVTLMAGVLSAALCGLQAANTYAQAQYEYMRENTPIKLVVTNLSATRRDHLNAPSFVFHAFNSETTKNNLMEYIKDVQMKALVPMEGCDLDGTRREGITLIGATDPEITGSLYSSGLERIRWFRDYDSSILQEAQDICLVPQSWLPKNADPSQPLTIDCEFTYTYGRPGFETTKHIWYTFTIAGIHSADESQIFCPFQTLLKISGKLSRPVSLDAIQATLIDNDLKEEFREASKAWFAEPNPTGAKTRWDYSWYFYYQYAMDIEDDQLINAERTLKTSMLVNEICAYLLFILSACASFFTGFLMIRQRKREILLMRTLGTPNSRIFAEFAIEQLLCLLAGTIVGGLFFLWQPLSRLAVFVAIYAFGLMLALLVFLNINLLSNIKEDE